MRRSILSTVLQSTAATSTVETAFAFILAVPTIFLAFELCLYAYAQAVLSDSARAGVRYAIVHGNDSSNCSGPSKGCADSSAANVVTAVQQYGASFLTSLSAVQVSVSYPDASSAPPSRVKVSVQYTYAPLIARSFTGHLLQATSEGRIVF